MIKFKQKRSKNIKTLGIKEVDKLIEELDIEPVLELRVRQVKWLYNNSNKMTMVYEEKLVRIIVHRLQERIRELEKNYFDTKLTTTTRDKY